MDGATDRRAVLDALDRLPPLSWLVILELARVVADTHAAYIVDDPSPEYALRDAIDAELRVLKPST